VSRRTDHPGDVVALVRPHERSPVENRLDFAEPIEQRRIFVELGQDEDGKVWMSLSDGVNNLVTGMVSMCASGTTLLSEALVKDEASNAFFEDPGSVVILVSERPRIDHREVSSGLGLNDTAQGLP
jgi:hypothetical protein